MIGWKEASQNISLNTPTWAIKGRMLNEWMDSIECPDSFVTDKPTDMEVDDEATDYMDEDPTVLMLREEGTYQEPPAIIEATIELKNQAWEGIAHPMDSVRKIKTVQSVTLAKKIKIVKPITLAKNIVSVSIESISTSISIPVKSIFDSFLVESVENSFPYNMIFDSAYFLALNVFIYEIGKETLNNKENMDTQNP